MATLASDNFNRDDSVTLGVNWTDDNVGFGIVSNKVIGVTDGDQSYWSGTFNPASADYDVTVTLHHTGTVSELAFFGRRTASNTFYWVAMNTFTQTIKLYKRVGGSDTELGSFSGGYSVNNTYTFRLNMVGSILKVYEGVTERISVSDSAITDIGKPGLLATSPNGSCDWDDFLVEGTEATITTSTTTSVSTSTSTSTSSTTISTSSTTISTSSTTTSSSISSTTTSSSTTTTLSIQAQFLGVDIMSLTKDLLDNPASQTQTDALINSIASDFSTITHIGISIPMNTNAEALAERGSNFSIEPATYAAQFTDKIHAVGKKVLWRGTDCFFEGIYNFTKVGKRNGNRFTYLVTDITDNFSSTEVRNHGYGLSSSAGNLSSNYLTSHQSGNDWTIVTGELTGPASNGWLRTCLFNASGLRDVVMVAKVKKVGNQQIICRASTDSNFPGYGLQIRDTNILRLERPGLENLGETAKTWVEGNYYWLKLECVGTTIRGKAWAVGDSEPGSWDLSITNSSYSYGFCGFSGESSTGLFDDMTITPAQDTDTWLYRAVNWINTNISLFETNDIIAPYPEASSHQSLTNQGTYNDFFVDLKYCLDQICSNNNITCYNGFSSHIWTSVIQGAISGSIFSIPQVASFDHYGTGLGLNKRFTSFSHGSSGASNTYTVPTSITENITNRHDFIPEKVSYNKEIDIYIVNKGTGDWTMIVHKANNDPVQMPNPQDLTDLDNSYQVTIANANLTNGALNTFAIDWDNPDTDVTYHFHLTSTVTDGTVKTTTLNDLNTLYCAGYKHNARPEALEIDLRKTYNVTGQPLYLQEWGDYWSTDASRSDPVRTEIEHESYLDSIYAVLQRLINEDILVGFNYWRVLGGEEAVMYDADPTAGYDYQMLYEGERLQAFFNNNQVTTTSTTTSSSTSTSTSSTTTSSSTSITTSSSTSTTQSTSTSSTTTSSSTSTTKSTSTSSTTTSSSISTSTSSTTTSNSTSTSSTTTSSSTSISQSTSTTISTSTSTSSTTTSSSISTSTSTSSTTISSSTSTSLTISTTTTLLVNYQAGDIIIEWVQLTTSTTTSSSTSTSTSSTTTSSSISTSTSSTTTSSSTSISQSTSTTISTSSTTTSSSTSTTYSTSTTSSTTTSSSISTTTSSSTSTTQSTSTSSTTTSSSTSTTTSTTTTLACTEIIDQSQTTGTTLAGFGEFNVTRYRGQGFIPSLGRLTAIEINLTLKGLKGLKVYIDTADSDSIPDHSPGSEIASFVITNADLSIGMTKYTFPSEINVTNGSQYVVYFAPWNTDTDTYDDDYRDLTWHNSNIYSSGKPIVNNGGTWSISNNGNLDLKFQIYGCEESGTTTSTTTSSSTSTSSTTTSSSTSTTITISTTTSISTSTSSTTTSSSTSITISTSTTMSTSTTTTLAYVLYRTRKGSMIIHNRYPVAQNKPYEEKESVVDP